MTATNKLELELLQNAAANQTLANITFALLNQLVQAGVVDKDLAAPPASPADEALYIVGASATGAWAGRDGQLAYWLVTAGAWQFITPKEGFFLHVNDEDVFYKFTGTAWEVFSGGGGGGGMTNPMTSIRDLIVGGAGGAATRLPGPTSEGMVLTRIGNALAWAIATGFANPMTAAGDIIFGGANGAATRLGAGTAGQVLTMVSGAPAWVTPSGGGGTGDFKSDGSVQMTGAFNNAPYVRANLSSNGVIPAYTALSNTIQVDPAGGAAITSLGTVPVGGVRRRLLIGFDGVTIQNSELLALPGGQNISANTSDIFDFESRGSGDSGWRLVGYLLKSGRPLIGFTEAQVRNTPLTGLPATTGDVTETDTVLSGIGKLQASKVDKASAVTSVAGRTGAVTLTKSDVGLANADNTADSAKPVSVVQQAALDAKAPIDQPSFTGSVTSVLAQNAFRAQAPANNPQTGLSLNIPMGNADQKTFEWLSSSQGSPRMMFRTINEAYSAGTEFLTAYRTATSHTMDRLVVKGVNMVVGQDAQVDTNYRLQVAGGLISTGPLKIGQYTLSTLPSPSAFNRGYIDVADASGGPKTCRSNGTAWYVLNTTNIVS